MAWKVSPEGAIEMDGLNPIWIGDDGTEVAFDAKANIIAAATARREAAESRKGLKEAEAKLSAYAGIDDPDAAIKALQFAGSMEGKKVMDDDGIKKLVEAAIKPLQEQNAVLLSATKGQEETIYKMKVSDKFNTSAFLKEKTMYGETPDVAEAYFGRNFKVVDGNTVAFDSSGNEIYSSINAGKLADFDEALSVLINTHPRRDYMLKGSGGNGSGQQQGNGNGSNSPKTITRAEFQAKSPLEQSQIAIERKIQIVD